MILGQNELNIKPTIRKDNIFLSFLLVLCIILMFINIWYVSIKNEDDKNYISLAGELRILSQSIAKYTSNAADGMQDAFEILRTRRDEFDDDLEILISGDPKINLAPSAVEIRKTALSQVEGTWKPLRDKIDAILNRQSSMLELHQISVNLSNTIPQFQDQLDKVLDILMKNNASAEQVYSVNKEKWISEKIMRNLDRVLAGGEDTLSAADAFSRQANLFGSYLNAMKEGNDALKIEKITDLEARKILDDIAEKFTYVENNVQQITKISEQLMVIRNAAYDIFMETQQLLERTTELVKAYSQASQKRLVSPLSAYIFGLISLMLFLWLAYRLYADTKVNLAQTATQHKANRAAVWRLLDELENLADGDLTIRATVGEDIIGAIAESVNYAINALKKLVLTINDTAVQVSISAQGVQSTVKELASASEKQAKEIIGATTAIHAMAASVEHVSSNASESAQVAEDSVNTAKNGVMIVQSTILGMEKIKEQIQGTAKQVKRLGESSQEIGDIISLIDEITDQTNILALNAAIQAAMAGEEGRGFSVIAEEIQRLAERSSQATKKIEHLVRAIQNDTKDTVKSMEQTTSEVVQGALLAQDAGVALGKIENVSSHLAKLIAKISHEAHQQADTASEISKTMGIIQKITAQTTSGTLATATAISQLTELALELRNSVAGFKLPVENEDTNDEERH